jgi:hypothetical protein
MKLIQETGLGQLIQGQAEDLVFREEKLAKLIFTSPPYRHLGTWREYMLWLRNTFEGLSDLLTRDGSMVVVLGPDWNPPYQTTKSVGALDWIATTIPLLQQFVIVHHDDLELSPSVSGHVTEMVALGKRALDRVEHAWWFGRSPDVELLGSTNVVDAYRTSGDADGRSMPVSVPMWFIQRMTEVGDLVVDPFAGSNSTGVASEQLGRRWMSIEKDGEVCTKAAQRLTKYAL